MSRKLLSSLLRTCKTHSTVSQCHAQTLLQSLLPNVILETDLLLAYTKLGLISHARKLFDKMPQRNMHSWNIMIASYTHNSMYFDALTVFEAFKRCGVLPDCYTLPPLFKIAIGIDECSLGWTCHGLVVKLGYEEIVVVNNSVLEFYVKCGTMSQALSVFSNHNAPRYENCFYNLCTVVIRPIRVLFELILWLIYPKWNISKNVHVYGLNLNQIHIHFCLYFIPEGVCIYESVFEEHTKIVYVIYLLVVLSLFS